MVRSMVAAVAGLKSHQSKMDVIGNNIANVNTWGYKMFSYNFADSMYANSTNSTEGSARNGEAGGRNASQVGYGSVMSSITNEFGKGAPSPSSNPLDCMIDGTGFFLVGNMINGSFTNVKDSGLYLSRVGIFRVDSNGYLVDDQRSYVYGYALEEGSGIPEVPASAASYDVANAEVNIQNLGGGQYSIEIAGITVETQQTEIEEMIKDWISKVAGKETLPDGSANPLQNYNVGYTNYRGTYNGEAASTGITVDLAVSAKRAGEDANRGSIITSAIGVVPVTSIFTGGTVTETAGQNREAGVRARYENQLSALRIPIDPRTGMQYEIQSYKINEDGTIVGVDKDNRTITIGKIALVIVENPNGLEKNDGYYYTVGANAGDVSATEANGGPAGKIMGGYLEMANVDLANEFSNMITCQRGFQANSKIITVTDEMLQELVNMKR